MLHSLAISAAGANEDAALEMAGGGEGAYREQVVCGVEVRDRAAGANELDDVKDVVACDVTGVAAWMAAVTAAAALSVIEAGELRVFEELQRAAAVGMGQVVQVLDAVSDAVALAMLRALAPHFAQAQLTESLHSRGHNTDARGGGLQGDCIRRGGLRVLAEGVLCHMWADAWILSFLCNSLAHDHSHAGDHACAGAWKHGGVGGCGGEKVDTEEVGALEARYACHLKVLRAVLLQGGIRARFVAESYSVGACGLAHKLLQVRLCLITEA
jgi:hypothetical protein